MIIYTVDIMDCPTRFFTGLSQAENYLSNSGFTKISDLSIEKDTIGYWIKKDVTTGQEVIQAFMGWERG